MWQDIWNNSEGSIMYKISLTSAYTVIENDGCPIRVFDFQNDI